MLKIKCKLPVNDYRTLAKDRKLWLQHLNIKKKKKQICKYLRNDVSSQHYNLTGFFSALSSVYY